jgi:hypothetical protein
MSYIVINGRKRAANRAKAAGRAKKARTQIKQSGGFINIPLAAAAVPALIALAKSGVFGAAAEVGKKIVDKISGKGIPKKKFRGRGAMFHLGTR